MANQRYEANESAIDKAKRLGTYKQIDRSKQYEPDVYKVDQFELQKNLLRNDNVAFEKIRLLEKLQLRNAVVIAAASTLLARAPEITSFLFRLFR